MADIQKWADNNIHIVDPDEISLNDQMNMGWSHGLNVRILSNTHIDALQNDKALVWYDGEYWTIIRHE